ncbi:MAG TPA: hypothetical protein VHA79_01500 [Mycobacteriales bacterium]|jgi:hypothetical protein|nr:hypothetical protein [Mycobacteriales bacterium]
MAADSATVSAVATALAGTEDTLVSVGSAVVPYAGGLLGLLLGWRLVRHLVAESADAPEVCNCNTCRGAAGRPLGPSNGGDWTSKMRRG